MKREQIFLNCFITILCVLSARFWLAIAFQKSCYSKAFTRIKSPWNPLFLPLHCSKSDSPVTGLKINRNKGVSFCLPYSRMIIPYKCVFHAYMKYSRHHLLNVITAESGCWDKLMIRYQEGLLKIPYGY